MTPAGKQAAATPCGEASEFHWTPVPDDLLRQYACAFRDEFAQAADRDEAARLMLADFCVRQSLGQPQSPVTLEWLAEVASAALDYADNAYRGFGLAPRPAHRSTGTGQDWLPRVAAVELLRRADTKAHALDVVAQAVGLKDTRRLEKAAAQHDLGGLDDNALCSMAAGVLPACISAIRNAGQSYAKLMEWLPPAQK